MQYDILSALVLFAFVSSITPGPNNVMLMASGANFGFRRTVPHMLGISLGHMFMICVVGGGLIQLFDAWPLSYRIMKLASGLYLIWLAWKIAHAAEISKGRARPSPLTFWQAAAFQWVNPKAWAMALTAVTAYMPEHSAIGLAVVALAFALVNLPSVSTWTVLGQQMARVLTSPSRRTAFNWTMAALLVLSILPVMWA